MLDVTKTFFETFEIEPDTSENAYFTGNYEKYPEITDTILLRLICMWNLCCSKKKDRIEILEYICVRDSVLLTYIKYKEYDFDVDYIYIKQQVQLLFKRI